MSVNINLKPLTNESKWATIKNGDFAVIEGNPQHPVPHGLYRIFIIFHENENVPVNLKQFILLPLFDGPFQEGMFPYMLTETPYPTIQQMVNKLNIEVETTQ